MKRIVVSILMLSLFLPGAYALPIDNFEELTKLGLSEDEIRKVTNINLDAEQAKKEATLELNILKAQLEKLLADSNPDMRQVEKLLRDSMEWKVKIELAEIKKRVELRKIIGEEKWRKLVNYLEKKKADTENKTVDKKDGKTKGKN